MNFTYQETQIMRDKFYSEIKSNQYIASQQHTNPTEFLKRRSFNSYLYCLLNPQYITITITKVRPMGCGSVTSQKPNPLTPNLSLNRIYQRLQEIGKGTFGTVYLCRNNLNGLHYALKVVDITAKNKDQAIKQVENLKRQIGVLKKLNHPNIVKYYSFDISPDGKQVEIVLQYAQKGSLKEYVKKKGQLEETQASAMTTQVLQGLAHLHKQSIVHRDLKCANILVMQDGTLKITDFGTAKHIKNSTEMEDIAQNASIKGTPYYMAPQILRRKGHGISADIWSLSCMVIEMLTGRAPWTALTNDFEEIIGYIVSGIHPPFPKNLTQECQQFLNGCFQNVPSQRFTSAELLSHPWIEGKKISNTYESGTKAKTRQQSAKYKNSLSKTDDGVEEMEGRGKTKEQKMREIDAYMNQRTKEKQRKKITDRESAKSKKGKSGNILFSQQNLQKEEDLEILQYEQVSRKLFTQDQNNYKNTKNQKNVQTAPHVKLPQNIILEPQLQPSQSKDKNSFNLNLNPTPALSQEQQFFKAEFSQRPKQNFIDTVISREQRLRYLQQQRILRQQRQQQKSKWQQQLKEGANYLKKEINSRYLP